MRPALVFGSYRSIAAALADSVRPKLEGSERVEVIVPTRSAAMALLGHLRSALPTTQLEIHSIENLATRVVNEAGRYPRLASEHEKALAMELACRSVAPGLAATPGMTSMLQRSERDVRDSGVSLSDLRYRIAGAARLTVSDRLRAIEEVWTAAGRILSDSGATTMPAILEDAITLIRAGADVPPQILFAFYDATGLQRSFLDALAETGRINEIYFPVPLDDDGTIPEHLSFASPFVEWARNLSDAETTLEIDADTPDWTIAAHPSPLRELHEVCRSIRSILDDGVPPHEIAIVARSIDPREANLLSAMASRFGFGLRGLPGRRLSGNRIARGVIDLILLQERNFLRRDVMEIIRSGARLPDIEGPLPSLDRLESATRKALIARGGRDLVLAAEKRARYRDDEPDETLLRYADLVDALDQLTTGFGGNRSGTAWSHSLDELLGMFRSEIDEDLAALEELRDLARSLRRGGFASKRFDARSIAGLIENAGALSPTAPKEPSIWVGDVMRFRGLDVRHLFVVRMQHDAVPQRRIEDALFPDIDRRTLGVRQVGDGREEETLLFSILAAGAREAIHFSFASSDSVGRSLRPSALVKDFVIARQPEARLDLLQKFHTWLANAPKPPSTASSLRESSSESLIDDATTSMVRALQLEQTSPGDSPFAGRVTPDAHLHERLQKIFTRISPSRLEHLGECPQRFFVSSVLGIREEEDPEPNVQIELRQKGLIDHQILEELYSSLTDDDWNAIESGDISKLSVTLRGRLSAVVEKRFRELDAEFPALNETIRSIERDETTDVLTRFAASDLAELATSGYRPAEFELLLDVESDDASKLPLGPIEAGIHGRIDRVDRHPDGAVRVIDYKAGKAFRQQKLESRIDDGLRLQLVVYALVVRRLWDLSPDQVSASIRPLRVDASETDKWGFRLAERYDRLTEMLDTLAGAIWQGRFPAVPYQDVCSYCVIRPWCRTRNDPGLAAKATRHGPAVRYLENEER